MVENNVPAGRPVDLVAIYYYYYLSLLHQQREQEEDAPPHCPIPCIIFLNNNPNTMADNNNGRRAGSFNYSDEELESLMELIVEVLPIDSEQWDTVVSKHDLKYPFDRSKKSIRNKYNAIKKRGAQLVTSTCLDM